MCFVVLFLICFCMYNSAYIYICKLCRDAGW